MPTLPVFGQVAISKTRIVFEVEQVMSSTSQTAQFFGKASYKLKLHYPPWKQNMLLSVHQVKNFFLWSTCLTKELTSTSGLKLNEVTEMHIKIQDPRG
jgi:hypothetical protein